MRNDAYAGLMSLGSEAFSAPLPPAPSEPPPLSARVRTGLYVLGGSGRLFARRDWAGDRVQVDDGARARAVGCTWRRWCPRRRRAQRAASRRRQRAPSQAQDERTGARPALEAAAATRGRAAVARCATRCGGCDRAAPVGAGSPTRNERSGLVRTPRSSSHADAIAFAPQAARLPAQLSREQVVAAMTRVQPAVAACFQGTHGSANGEHHRDRSHRPRHDRQGRRSERTHRLVHRTRGAASELPAIRGRVVDGPLSVRALTRARCRGPGCRALVAKSQCKIGASRRQIVGDHPVDRPESRATVNAVLHPDARPVRIGSARVQSFCVLAGSRGWERIGEGLGAMRSSEMTRRRRVSRGDSEQWLPNYSSAISRTPRRTIASVRLSRSLVRSCPRPS